jgi:N-acetylated-alpha-linked acidic dipeptidase
MVHALQILPGVFGAADPNSGTATMLEVARGFSNLLSQARCCAAISLRAHLCLRRFHLQGWIPGRTIQLCSWDGEEYGLLGSTAFGTHIERCFPRLR